ncbi:patatin-like protein 3 [Phalaenopsis equestris]|uniref:patatin-like protein 3 n=1 Tax=Phalaenopsis equestris TaxID=78828 RepID=UPI0009E3F285|nr:patatin-like protein 3 [Phalaenopsis equestris]
MASTPAMSDPCFDVDKLSYEIFRILESKFLFGYDDPKFFLNESSFETPAKNPVSPTISSGKVRILSIDAVSDYLLAAAFLARIECSLRIQSGDPAARIADFFDIAAGSGAGGVISAMLFARGVDGRPLFSAEEALCFLAKNGPPSTKRKGLLRAMIRKPIDGAFRRIFGEATLRDTVKPLLIPCFDFSTGAPFLFSRADAVETDGYDFRMREICAATCGVVKAMEMKSIDGRTRIAAIGGGVAMANPTAAAITHVFHNKQEFPFATRVDDLLVLSIAGAESELTVRSSHSTAEILRIAGNGMADTVDQAMAMAFSQNSKNNPNYLRLQLLGLGLDNTEGTNRDAKKMMQTAEAILSQRNVESVLFQGKRLSQETYAEKLDRFAGELLQEHDKRKKSRIPTVFIKQIMTPRTSSSTTTTTSTTISGSLPTQ